MKKIIVCALQLESRINDVTGNLQRAETCIKQATAKGAELILLPELYPNGYLLQPEIWSRAETRHGISMTWLKQMSALYKTHIGFSILECTVDGAYYNTFFLAGPEGTILGEVSKSVSSSFEAFFIEGKPTQHVFNVPSLGIRVGVAICFESLLCAPMIELKSMKPDLLLAPFAAAAPPKKSRAPQTFLDFPKMIAQQDARILGVPVVMANKVGFSNPFIAGIWYSDLPMVGYFETDFLGHSTIVDESGEIVTQKAQGEHMLLAEVQVFPSLQLLDQYSPIRATIPVPRHWGSTLPAMKYLSFSLNLTQLVGWIYYKYHSNTRRNASRLIWGLPPTTQSNNWTYLIASLALTTVGLVAAALHHQT